MSDSIDKLALDLIGLVADDKVSDLRLEELYDIPDTRKASFAAMQSIMVFVSTCIQHKAWGVLQTAWRDVDLTRLRIELMLSFLTGSHLVRPGSLLPDRLPFVARCKAEVLRRGEPQERADRLFDFRGA